MNTLPIEKPRVLARLAVLVGIFPLLVLELVILNFMTQKFSAGDCPTIVLVLTVVLQVAILIGFGLLTSYVWRPQRQGKED